MRTKKNFLSLLTILMVAMLTVVFTSCGDDEKESDPSPVSSSLVGKWKFEFSSGYVIMILNEDNTYRIIEYDHGAWEDDDIGTYYYDDSKNTLKIKEQGDDEWETWEVLSLDANKLVIDNIFDQGINTFYRYTGSVPNYPAIQEFGPIVGIWELRIQPQFVNKDYWVFNEDYTINAYWGWEEETGDFIDEETGTYTYDYRVGKITVKWWWGGKEDMTIIEMTDTTIKLKIDSDGYIYTLYKRESLPKKKYEVPDNVKAVDLGLSVKWASLNVGAKSESDYGDLFNWGANTYNEFYENAPTMSNISGTRYDVAHNKWGGSWRLPTHSEVQELLSMCDHKWTTVNGIKGYEFSRNGKKIFLPAAGDCYGYDGKYGYYWTGTQNDADVSCSFILFFNDSQARADLWEIKTTGLPVRPVCD